MVSNMFSQESLKVTLRLFLLHAHCLQYETNSVQSSAEWNSCFFCIVSGVAESSSPAISGVPWIICISWMMWGPVHNQLNFTVYKLLTPPNPTIHTQIKPSSLKMMNLKKMNHRCHSIHRKLPQVHDNPCNATSLLTLVGTVVVKVSCIKINTLI